MQIDFSKQLQYVNYKIIFLNDLAVII